MQERMPMLRDGNKRPRSSRKLRLFLILLFVVLLAVLFLRSSLSKVSQIEVTGSEVLQQDAVVQASGVAVGDNFFLFDVKDVEKQLKLLPAIENVQVSKKFPGLMRIEVQEYPRVAYQLDATGAKVAVLGNGLIVATEEANIVFDKPFLTGWQEQDPLRLQLCQTLALIPDKLLAEISEIKPSPTKTYPDKIKMYTTSQYEVYTTVSYLPDKIKLLEEMILQMEDKKAEDGVFELLEVNTHIPYKLYYENTDEKKPIGEKDDSEKKEN